MKYDVAVIGLGGMGSAVLAEAARRGASALGIEQFGAAHPLGSSHGKSRMIRKAYFENPDYVPLLRRAYELWRELEQRSGEEILRATGVLTVGRAESAIISGTRQASALHDLPLESLSKSDVAARYPTLRMQPDEVALFEEEAGMLDPERAMRAQLKSAQTSGAQIRLETTMTRWAPTDDGVDVSLSDGSKIVARTVVLSLGAWFKATLENLGVPIRVQRNVQAWFSPATKAYAAPNFPGFLLDRPELPAPLYGFPDCGDGVKAAFHGAGDFTETEQLQRTIDRERDVAPLARALDAWMPGAAATLRDAAACMYTLTPDEHFVIDRHPSHPNVILCGGFSGHGFKFAPVVGEIAVDLALEGGSHHQIDFLSLHRFGQTD